VASAIPDAIDCVLHNFHRNAWLKGEYGVESLFCAGGEMMACSRFASR